MMRNTSTALVCFCLLLSFGCGALRPFDIGRDNGNRVLHFAGRDETEHNFRARIHQTTIDNPAAMTLLCDQLKGPTADEALAVLRHDDDAEGGPIPPGAIRKPGQKANDTDSARSKAIIAEECAHSPFR